MTDTPTPGSEWLLPVTIEDISTAQYGFLMSRVSGKQRVRIDYPATLIPASRLADLEAEVARWQQLYEDARHDLTKVEMEVERLRAALKTVAEKLYDDWSLWSSALSTQRTNP
jgi:uncharacterized coiled-coil protein SlyX